VLYFNVVQNKSHEWGVRRACSPLRTPPGRPPLTAWLIHRYVRPSSVDATVPLVPDERAAARPARRAAPGGGGRRRQRPRAPRPPAGGHLCGRLLVAATQGAALCHLRRPTGQHRRCHGAGPLVRPCHEKNAIRAMSCGRSRAVAPGRCRHALRRRHRRQRHSVVHRLIWWASLAMLAASAVLTAGLVWVSMWNYPGGAAVQRLPAVLAGHSTRACTAAAMQPGRAANITCMLAMTCREWALQRTPTSIWTYPRA